MEPVTRSGAGSLALARSVGMDLLQHLMYLIDDANWEMDLSLKGQLSLNTKEKIAFPHDFKAVTERFVNTIAGLEENHIQKTQHSSRSKMRIT